MFYPTELKNTFKVSKLSACCVFLDSNFRATAEPQWAKYIPGGYSRSRCLKLSGMPMISCILVLAGTCILFFGYDAAVMSLVNVNPDYLRHMDAADGTNNDAARVGGIVSFWFLGFLVGTTARQMMTFRFMLNMFDRSYHGWKLCR